MTVWISLIVLICGMLLILGYNLEDNKIQREVKSAANNYIKDNNMTLSFGSASIVYLDELFEYKYLEDDDKYIDKCINSVVVTKGLILDDYQINILCEEENNNEVSE